MTTEQIRNLETINLNHKDFYTRTKFPKESAGYDGHGTMAYAIKVGRKRYILEGKRVFEGALEITLMPYAGKTFSKYATNLFSFTLKPWKEIVITRDNFAGLIEWGEWQKKASKAALELATITKIII